MNTHASPMHSRIEMNKIYYNIYSKRKNASRNIFNIPLMWHMPVTDPVSFRVVCEKCLKVYNILWKIFGVYKLNSVFEISDLEKITHIHLYSLSRTILLTSLWPASLYLSFWNSARSSLTRLARKIKLLLHTGKSELSATSDGARVVVAPKFFSQSSKRDFNISSTKSLLKKMPII